MGAQGKKVVILPRHGVRAGGKGKGFMKETCELRHGVWLGWAEEMGREERQGNKESKGVDESAA